MGIFDFFKKKPTTSVNDTQHTTSEIKLTSINHGSHGDNFGGLLGFQFLNLEVGEQFIFATINLCTEREPILETKNVSIHQTMFATTTGSESNLGVRIIKPSKNKILSAYPYLNTNYTIPFTTKEIIEWSHMDNLEAEIKGSGRDTFGFDFFATDYAIHKEKYKTTKQLNIHVSAIGFVLDHSNLEEMGDAKFSANFAAYMPSQDLPRQTYYDFIGSLIDFNEVVIKENNTGYIIKVKLINNEENPDFFTIEMFVNKENMRIETLEKGMKITGAFWFQGEIAM